jgi:transcriptional regulator with XRE-family HTH domain
VAQRLAALRRERRLSMKTAAGAAGLNTSTIYRIEHGLVAPRASTTRTLLDLYGVRDGRQQRHLLSLLCEEREPGWYDRPEVPLRQAWFLALEDRATSVRTYAPRYVPPLLQTRAYAEAAIRAHGRPGEPPEQAGRLAEVALRRQRLLGRPGGPRLWAVIDPSAAADPPLRRVADRLEQFDALIAATEQPRVALQVSRPSAETGFLYHGPPLTLLSFAEPDRPDAIVLHLLGGPMLVEDPGQADDHRRAFARLALAAFGVESTFDVLSEMRAELLSRADGTLPLAAHARS